MNVRMLPVNLIRIGTRSVDMTMTVLYERLEPKPIRKVPEVGVREDE